MQINVWWRVITKNQMYLILQFYSNRENLMLTRIYVFYSITSIIKC